MMEQQPQRVLVIVSNKSPHWNDSWSSPEEVLLIALNILRYNQLPQDVHVDKPELKLLAKQRWETRVFLVFDVANSSYDPSRGHLPQQNKLPVTVVRLSKEVQAYPASPFAQDKVNRDVARAHNDHGWDSIPPFVTDYTSGPPFYPSPRDLSLLV